MNQKPQPTKPIKISNVGPFDDSGIQINFGAKQNPNKANIHILVGENGSGKSTVLKEVFADCLGVKSLIKIVKLNPVPYFDPSSRIKNQEYPTFFYTPSETPEEILYKLYQQTVISLRSKSEWVYKYSEQDYIKYIIKLEGNRDKLVRTDIPKAVKLEIRQQITLTEKLEWFIKQIYNIDFKYKFKSIKEDYLPYFNNRFFQFSELSTGYRQIISLITDILIKVWSIESDLEDKSQGQFVLLLDEIDVHLHPKAQRRILPALQSMFPNSEIFCTTHSPFVVNSVDDAWVYEIEKDIKILEGRLTSSSESYDSVLTRDFDVSSRFGNETQDLLNTFYDSIQEGKENSKIIEQLIAKESPEIDAIISYHLQSLSMAKYGKNK